MQQVCVWNISMYIYIRICRCAYVYRRMFVYIDVCMVLSCSRYMCTYIYICIYIHVNVFEYMKRCFVGYICTCTCTWTCVGDWKDGNMIYLHIRAFTNFFMYIYNYAHTYIYMHILDHTHTHIHTHTHTHGDTHTYAHHCTGVYVHTLGITKSSVVTSLDQPRTLIHTLQHIHTHSLTHTPTHTHAHVHWIACTRTCVLNYLHWIVCIRKCARLLQLQSLSQLQQGGQILWDACRTNEVEHPRNCFFFRLHVP